MSASWKAELDELDRLRAERPPVPSQAAQDLAADMARRADLPKIPPGDDRAFLKNLDKILRGDVAVGGK